MKQKIIRAFLSLLTLPIVVVMSITFMMIVGCDEGMNMIDPVITEPGEEPMTPDGPITTNGDMKQPPEEIPGDNKNLGSEQPELTPEPDPEKPETSEPTSTVTITAVTQASDTSVTVSGTSTNIPERAKVTIVLGDGAITVKAVVTKDGTWTTTVPAKKTARLSPGTIMVKATAKKVTAKSSFEIAPPPEPTLTIDTVVQADDGSVTVSGTSTEMPTGETVTVTFAGTLIVTATVDNTGAWTAMLAGTKAANLVVGTVGVKAAAGAATAASSFENNPPDLAHGIPVSTDVERIKINIVADVYGADDPHFQETYQRLDAEYGSFFDLETEEGQAYFRKFVVYRYKNIGLGNRVPDADERWALRDQYFEEAYGFSADFARWLVFEIYLKETGEKITGLWQKNGIAMEYLLLQIANPDATEEELLELLRESIRAGNVSIAF